MKTYPSSAEDPRIDQILVTIQQLLSEHLSRLPPYGRTGIRETSSEPPDALDEIIGSLDLLAEGFDSLQADHARATDQLRKSEAQLERERRYRTIVEEQPDLLCRFEPDGTLTFVNHGYAEYFGRSIEELQGFNFYNLIPEEDRQAVREHFSSMGPGKLTANIVHEVVSADGQVRWQEWTDRAFVGDDGTVIGFQSIGRDITDRKQAEEALRESESRNRALIDGVPDIMFRFKRDGTVLDYKAEGKRWSMSAGEIIGAKITDVPTSAEAGNALLEASVRAVETGELQVLEYDLPAPGSIASFEARIVKSGADEVIAVVRDVTERRQAEAEQARLIADLERKNAELERFTYTVSHDLKSPLVTIRGFLGFVERDAVAGDVERLRGDIERIKTATETMRRLLDDLLELSRVGRLINAPEVVSLVELARQASAAVAGSIRERGVKLEISPALPVVSGDRQRLFEALQNLIENAVKFMGEQPEPRVEIGFRPGEGEAVCYVRDNGMGIAPEYHEQIFGLFQRLNVAVEGTGVGLTLVKRIVELHGGRLWVESEGEGQGSTFCFTLAEEE